MLLGIGEILNLFSDNQTGLEDLPIQGGKLSVWREFLSLDEASKLYSELSEYTTWEAREIVVWGKRVLQPRLIAWYGDEGATYTYSGSKFEPLEWTNTLLSLKLKLQKTLNCEFNSCLLNFYRNGSDAMGWHSDDEPELGLFPKIASLSLGAKRDLMFRSKKNAPQLTPFRIELRDGDLLVMDGALQTNWDHSIPRSTRVIDPRINLTFRKIESFNKQELFNQ